ncbi:MAG: cyclodeaminase/cyclohydrolase family protein [Clostridiales bacterium]|jgi:formiminotetrahydrofolate cyclodeaminase|nr:cyclodeaminase/cyclohydrolase family protein [Clostridiales bacterium]
MSFAELSARSFTEVLASNEPVPGGGGASALTGAVGTALASMVGNFTAGKKKYAEFEPDIQRILKEADELRITLLNQIDEDAKCFEPLSKAYGIPKDDPKRDEIMEDALRLACTAPLAIMKTVAKAIELHAELAVKGSSLMLSDVGVGVLCCKTALMGASLNIFINVRLMKDTSYASNLKAETEALLDKYCTLADKTYTEVFEKLR